MKRYLTIIIGIIFIIVGCFMYFRNSYLTKNCTVEAEAVVVDMKQELSTDDSTSYMYYPIIEYQAREETKRVTIDNGSSTPAYMIDEKITILYNPNNPEEFIIKGEKSLNIFSISFVVLGLFIAGYGIKIALKKD